MARKTTYIVTDKNDKEYYNGASKEEAQRRLEQARIEPTIEDDVKKSLKIVPQAPDSEKKKLLPQKKED